MARAGPGSRRDWTQNAKARRTRLSAQTAPPWVRSSWIRRRRRIRGRGRGRPLEAELLLSAQGRCLGRPLSGRVGPAPHCLSAGKSAPGVWFTPRPPLLPLPRPRQWVPQWAGVEGAERSRGSSRLASLGHPRFRMSPLVRLGSPRARGQLRLCPGTALCPCPSYSLCLFSSGPCLSRCLCVCLRVSVPYHLAGCLLL